MYDLLGTEIEQRQGRLAPQQQQPQAKRASLEPRINQILNQQQEMYKLMVGRKSNSANAPTPQINELIQLAERFFKQMTKDVTSKLCKYKSHMNNHSHLKFTPIGRFKVILYHKSIILDNDFK